MEHVRGFSGPNADQERAEFVELMLAIAEVTKERLSTSGLDVYEMVLFPKYTFAQVRRVLIEMLDEVKFVPKPAEIGERIDGGKLMQANNAWLQVRNAVSEIGRFRTVVFDDPATHAAIHAMGGWITLCERLDEKSEYALEKEFKLKYAMGALQFPPMLVGVNDLRRLASGKEVLPQVVGDVDKAKAIWRKGDVKMLPGARA